MAKTAEYPLTIPVLIRLGDQPANEVGRVVVNSRTANGVKAEVVALLRAVADELEETAVQDHQPREQRRRR